MVRPSAGTISRNASKMERHYARKDSRDERNNPGFSARTFSRDALKHGLYVHAQFTG
jgi:hypothetical protein